MFKLKLTAFLLATILTSCISTTINDGSNTIIRQSANPNKSKKAILFLREAGATVANSYQVSVIDFNTDFDTSSTGNTFTVDTDHNTKLILRAEMINFKWISDDTLEIDYHPKLRTFIKNKVVDSIKIIYNN